MDNVVIEQEQATSSNISVFQHVTLNEELEIEYESDEDLSCNFLI